MKSVFRKPAVAAMLACSLVLAGSGARAADPNIVEKAAAAGQFKTLIAALDAAGLTDTLKGPGPFTVFAPTDAAFAKLPASTLQNLLKPENKAQLVAILTYHAVPEKMVAADVAQQKDLKTVNGKMLPVTTKPSSVMVGDATIVTTDVAASNGVIHVIDAVVLPPAN